MVGRGAILADQFVANSLPFLIFGGFRLPSDDFGLSVLLTFACLVLVLTLGQNETIQLGVALPDTQRPVLTDCVELPSRQRSLAEAAGVCGVATARQRLTHVQAVLLEETAHDHVFVSTQAVVDQVGPALSAKHPRGHVFTAHCKTPEANKQKHVKSSRLRAEEQRGRAALTWSHRSSRCSWSRHTAHSSSCPTQRH